MILLFQRFESKSRQSADFWKHVEGGRLRFLASVQARSATLVVTETAPGVEARAPAPATINSQEAGIRVARTVVAAGISVWAGIGIPTGYAARAAALQIAAVKILLRNGLKRLLTLRGVNADGIDQAKAQLFFGLENRGAATREEDRADACGCACSSADGCASAPVSSGADDRAESSGGANGRGVLAMRSSAGAFP